MEFNQLIDKIEVIKLRPLPGIESHKKLAPHNRVTYEDYEIPKNAREAGVMILLYADKFGKSNILLTKRANYKGAHSGQISFPGGKKETFDFSLKETALRETFEEVGILETDINVIKKLTPIYIPPSNFKAIPYLGVIKDIPVFKNNYEVEELIHLPINTLLGDKFIDRNGLSVTDKQNKDVTVPCFIYKTHKIWGATAMILNEFKEVLKTL